VTQRPSRAGRRSVDSGVVSDNDFPIAGYGRRQLIDTAERLLDEHGIDGVSGRAIAAAAGHRNNAAVNYHFGDRDNLVRTVLERRALDLDVRRHALLDELEAAGNVDPRAALTALFHPLVELLDDQGGRRYLRVLNQAANHPGFYERATLDFTPSLARSAAHLAPLVAHLSPPLRAHRARLGLGLALFALAEQARLIDTEPPPRPLLSTDEFLADLLVGTIAYLAA
jgi:AcrR family transcriptional regulator